MEESTNTKPACVHMVAYNNGVWIIWRHMHQSSIGYVLDLFVSSLAFPQAKLEEDVFMELPAGVEYPCK